MPISLTYTGVVVMLLVSLAKAGGYQLSEADIQKAVDVIVTLIGAALALYGRYRAGGVNLLGIKK